MSGGQAVGIFQLHIHAYMILQNENVCNLHFPSVQTCIMAVQMLVMQYVREADAKGLWVRA